MFLAFFTLPLCRALRLPDDKSYPDNAKAVWVAYTPPHTGSMACALAGGMMRPIAVEKGER